MVDPASSVPYWMIDCRVRSSADEMGTYMRSMVRNAARLAVYVDTMMSVKNHHTPPTVRPDADLPAPVQCAPARPHYDQIRLMLQLQ